MDVVLGAAFALLGIGVIVGAQSLTSIGGLPVGPGLFPTVTGAAMLIFGAVLVGQGWFAPTGELIGVPDEVAELAEDPNPPQRSWLDIWFIPLLLIAVAATIPLIPALGFLIAGTVFTAVIVVLCGGSLLRAVIFSPLATVFVYALFFYGLRVPLPRGLLG
jgi:putative tricarboxylic transport membrane protein